MDFTQNPKQSEVISWINSWKFLSLSWKSTCTFPPTRTQKLKPKLLRLHQEIYFEYFPWPKFQEKKIDSTKVLALLCWACYKSKHTCNREERKLSNYTHERYLEWANQSSSNKVLGLAHFIKRNLTWVFVFFINMLSSILFDADTLKSRAWNIVFLICCGPQK